MLKRLIIFLIRCKLGVEKYQWFKFTNQKSKTESYVFTETALEKTEEGRIVPSRVSLNWLLDDNCHIQID